jgi:hypothetical protein
MDMYQPHLHSRPVIPFLAFFHVNIRIPVLLKYSLNDPPHLSHISTSTRAVSTV